MIDACQNPIEGVQIRTKDPLQDGVVEYRFYDPAGNPPPPVSRILMAGPNGGQVVTTLNTTKYKINADGVMFVAPSPMVTISSQQPFKFTTVVESDNYLAVVQPVVITNTGRQTRYVRRINLLKPPSGLAAARTTGRATTDGVVSATFKVTTAGQDNDADRATLTMPTGTRLTDRDGQPLGGELTMSLIHTNARVNPTSQVPGGGILSYVNGLNGTPSPGTLRVTSMAGSVTLEVYNDTYQLATRFSQAVPWTMDLNPATINGQTGRAIQPGDSIPLFSYDAYTGRWQQENPGVVVRNATTNRLEYQAIAAAPIAYVAAWTESICDLGPLFKVSSKLANVDVNYLCKLIDVTTGAQVSAFYANVNNGAQIGIYNQSRGRQYKLQVFDETDAWGKGKKGGLIAESGVGSTCDRTPIPINLADLPIPPVMTLEFYFSCPGGTQLDESSLPSLIRTQYSEAGKESWRDLITATRTQRKVASYKLQVGRRYDLRASLDGGATWPLRENNYLIDQPEWTLKIRAETYCK